MHCTHNCRKQPTNRPDTALSPDNRFLVYTTIAPIAYMVHVGGPLDLVSCNCVFLMMKAVAA